MTGIFDCETLPVEVEEGGGEVEAFEAVVGFSFRFAVAVYDAALVCGLLNFCQADASSLYAYI